MYVHVPRIRSSHPSGARDAAATEESRRAALVDTEFRVRAEPFLRRATCTERRALGPAEHGLDELLPVAARRTLFH